MKAAADARMRVGFVTQIFPWITQTFAYNEVLAWLRSGVDVEPIAFHRPPESVRSSFGASDESAPPVVRYTSELGARFWLHGLALALRSPLIAVSTLALVATKPYARRTTLRLRATAIWSWLRGLPIAALARERSYDMLHADFADQTATSAWVASRLAAIPFSFRSHGSFNPQLLDEKVRAASAVLCISAYDRNLVLAHSPTAIAEKVVVSHLGVDAASWSSQPDVGSVAHPLILCVGTLQEKKGQRYLIEACAILQRKGIEFRCMLIGDGPDRKMLQGMISTTGLGSQVEITGYRTAREVRAAMEGAMIVCLPCVVAANGDEDGLPLALMEGMAAGKACVSTRIAGIPELVLDEVTGMLVPERDAAALALTLERLLSDAGARRALGEAARRHVQTHFDVWCNGRKAAEVLDRIT